MAESADPAQVPTLCQFCEESEISCKCFNCEMFLCQICTRRIHFKIKEILEHKVINLKDLETIDAIDMQRRADLRKLTCKVHNGQTCISFCSECKGVICLTCLNESHQAHKQINLKDAYEETISCLHKLKEDINIAFPKLESESIKLNEILANNEIEYNEAKKSIIQQEKREKDAVTRHAQMLLKELEKHHHSMEVKTKQGLSKVQKGINDLNIKKENTEKKLSCHHVEEIFETIDSYDIEVYESGIRKTLLKFMPADLGTDEKSIGAIYEIPEISCVHTFKTGWKNVTNIINLENNQKIVSSIHNSKFQQFTFNGKELLSGSSKYNISVSDMAIMKNGDVVFSGGSELRIYSKTGALRPFKTFCPLLILGVHVNKYNEVVVGLLESCSVTVKKDSIRRVVVLNQSGDIQHIYEYDRSNQRLFTTPRWIVTCNDTFCVVDTFNEVFQGRVVALTYGGQVKWTYNGKGNINQSKFYPRGMTVTSSDMILVSDDENHAIHVLNLTGQVTVCHKVGDIGIKYPFSLDIDSEGLLWVGCGTLNNNKYIRDNIHVLKI